MVVDVEGALPFETARMAGDDDTELELTRYGTPSFVGLTSVVVEGGRWDVVLRLDAFEAEPGSKDRFFSVVSVVSSAADETEPEEE